MLQMGAIDELRRRQRVVSWQFLDFVEGLCRLAEALALPTEKELDDIAKKGNVVFTQKGHLRQWEYIQGVNVLVLTRHRRPSFGLLAPTSDRPLADKVRAFLGYMMSGLCVKWGVEQGNVDKLVNKLSAMSVMLSGGIELA